MTIDYLTEVDIVFNGIEVQPTEFIELNITESCFALPIIEVKLKFIDENRFREFSTSDKINITITYSENKGNAATSKSIKFQCMVINKVSPTITQNKEIIARCLFHDESFNVIRGTKTYKDYTPNMVLNDLDLGNIKLNIDNFSIENTFYRFNTNCWDFIQNYVTPFVISEKGLPLMALALKDTQIELILKDSTNKEVQHKVSSKGGEGIFEYENLSMQTEFDKQQFIMHRRHSVVVSSYTKVGYTDLENSLDKMYDLPVMFDNGNCNAKHTLNSVINTQKFIDRPTYIINFKQPYNPIRLLDTVEVMTSEQNLNKIYHITKVVTKINTEVQKTYFMKEF